MYRLLRKCIVAALIIIIIIITIIIIIISFFFYILDIFSCQANAIGRSAKTVREFLEKHYTDEVADSDDETIKLAIKALLEVSQCLFVSLVSSKGFI